MVQQLAHAGAYDFELASSLGQLEIVGSGERSCPNLAISSIFLRARRCRDANILQDPDGLSLTISSLLTQCFEHCQILWAHRCPHFLKLL